MQNQIVEAVGLASWSNGPRSWRLWLRHGVLRHIVRFLFWKPVPLGVRQWAMFRVLHVFRMRSIFAGASMGNTFENDLLELIFKTTTIANIAINATSSPLTSLYYALHTADPGEGGDQTTSESAYTNYVRVAGTRSGVGFTVSGASVSPAASVDFASSGASGTTITHFSIGVASSSTSKILFSGTVTPNIAIGAAGITPRLTTATAITLD